jgi:hypothetical protein
MVDLPVQNRDNRQITSTLATSFSSTPNGGDRTFEADLVERTMHGEEMARFQAAGFGYRSMLAGDGGIPPLPGFLAVSQVRMAVHRAAALLPQSQWLPHDVSPTHFPPSPAERPRFHLERGIGGYQKTNMPLADALTRPHSSPSHLSPTSRGSASEHGQSLPERFVSGKETESVLRLAKRLKLRPKDLYHRQSLTSEALGSSSAEEAQGGSPAPLFTPGYPARYQPRDVGPPASAWEQPFMITLIFGRQQLVLHGSMGMPVDELHHTAGSLASMNPSSIQLVAGGDHFASWHCLG